jgi:hypothetical protein
VNGLLFGVGVPRTALPLGVVPGVIVRDDIVLGSVLKLLVSGYEE